MSSVPKQLLTPEQYLARERAAEFRSEYLSGEMFAMAGTSRKHSLVGANILSQLHQQLRQRECEVYQNEMRVRVSPTGLYTYPDIAVVCDEPRFADAELDTLLNPTLLVEVLSKSTEGYDRGAKFEHYRQIDSLTQYVLVSQDKYHVEVFSRQTDGRWVLWETNDPAGIVQLERIGCELEMKEIYAKVQLDQGSDSISRSATSQVGHG